MEQSLYAQVVKLRHTDLEFVATDRNKNEANFCSYLLQNIQILSMYPDHL